MTHLDPRKVTGRPPASLSLSRQTYFEDNPRDLQLLRHDLPLHPAVVKPHLGHVPDYLGEWAWRGLSWGGGGDAVSAQLLCAGLRGPGAGQQRVLATRSQGALLSVAAQRGREGAVLVTQEQRHLPTASGQPAGRRVLLRGLCRGLAGVRAEARTLQHPGKHVSDR